MTDFLKILSLKVDNFKRVEAVEIQPTGNIIRITGKNDQGKSSLLSALDAALAGGKTPEMPIRKGQLKGTIEVTLGTSPENIRAVVQRTYIQRDDKPVLSTLTVTTPDGAKYGKPQEFLDKVLGGISLDPVKFLDMKPEQQFAAVRAFVPGFDFDDADAKTKLDYTARTELNRKISDLESAIAAIPAYPEDWPSEEIDVEALIVGMNEAETANEMRLTALNTIDLMRVKADNAQQSMDGYDREIAQLQAKIDHLKTAKAEEMNQRDTLLAGVAAAKKERIPEEIDLTELRTQFNEAHAHNRKVDQMKTDSTRRDRQNSDIVGLKAEALALTKAMDDRKAAGQKAIAEAKMPIDGLSFDDGKVLLNGIVFSQTSFSKRLLTAISIAAAHAPELRLIRIEDGDKLDDDAWTVLGQFAIDNNMQIFTETVTHGAPVGFIIEDGKLKGIAE